MGFHEAIGLAVAAGLAAALSLPALAGTRTHGVHRSNGADGVVDNTVTGPARTPPARLTPSIPVPGAAPRWWDRTRNAHGTVDKTVTTMKWPLAIIVGVRMASA